MADATVTPPAPRKRRRWLRALAWVFGVLIVLLVAAYFIGTSSAFFKAVILPKVGNALNARLTVSDASISPFRQVVLRDLRVQTTGAEPLATVPEVRVRYSLMDIIRGNIHVEELTVTSPTVILVKNPDGTSNLDPLLKSQNKPPQPEQKPSKPAQINIGKLALTDATIRQVQLYQGNHKDLTDLSHVNVTAENLRNGQTGKLALAADIRMDNNPPPPETNGVLQAKLNGNFTIGLSADLKPSVVQGNTRFEVTQASGGLAQASALAANLDCDVTPTDIKQVVLRFQKGDTRLGELRVNGPFDIEKTEGRVAIQLLNIDKNLLNLAGASSGVDFGPTTINSSNLVQLARNGADISATGDFNLNRFQVTRTNVTTPPLNLRAQYDATVDRSASNAVLRVLTLSANQNGRQILRGDLTSPMPFSWGKTRNPVGDAAFNLAVTQFDLADWKAFLGDVAPAGVVNAKLNLLSQQGGDQLTFDLNSQIENLTAGSGSNQITQATVTMALRGQAAKADGASKLNRFNLSDYKLTLARQNQTLLTAAGSGAYDNLAETADVQLNAQLMLARLLQALPRPDLNVSSGTAELNVRVTQKQKNEGITGNFALTDLTGNMGSNVFRHFGTTADLDISMTPQQVDIRKLNGQLKEGTTVGGTFGLTGTYDLTNKAARLNATLSNFNEAGLRPFLEPSLGDKQLQSILLNGNAAVQYDPNAASAIKCDLQLTNLVVNDPKGQFPKTPLAAGLLLDAALNKQIADLRQCQLSLTPTARATNSLQLTGRVDMSQTNATQGSLKLAADSLDLTSYYDLFGGQKKPEEKTPPSPPGRTAGPTAPPSAGPETEPPPKQLPFRNFAADANIRRLYLHEVEIADLQISTKIDGGHITLQPCKLALNGAPVNSTVDVDLGVPGYKYTTTFNAQSIPLAPLVNTFQPDRRGLLSGTMTAQANVRGQGTTGASLQKTLEGQFDLASTNLNLVVDNIPGTSRWGKVLKVLVNAITVVPDLLKNPGGAASLVQGAESILGFGGRSAAGSGGEAGATLKKSPINSIAVRGNMGSGQVVLQQAMVQSPAFRADATGTVKIDSVLTNSPVNIPVSVSLERSVAQFINLAPANAPTNEPYVKLPDYLSIEGTLGDPKSRINKMALLGSVLQGASGVAGKNSGLLQGLGSALTGGNRAGSNAPAASTNQPGTGVGGLLRGLGGALGSGSAPPGTNTPPAQTNQSPVGNLLNNLLNPKK